MARKDTYFFFNLSSLKVSKMFVSLSHVNKTLKYLQLEQFRNCNIVEKLLSRKELASKGIVKLCCQQAASIVNR